jgi:transcriptional regulator with XRE-family HTH domain
MTNFRRVAAIRAARAALGWSQHQLAERAGVAVVSLARLEAGMGSARMKTIDLLIDAIEAGGVTVIDNEPNRGFTLIVHGDALDSRSVPK